jgi:hypothetical protein
MPLVAASAGPQTTTLPSRPADTRVVAPPSPLPGMQHTAMMPGDARSPSESWPRSSRTAWCSLPPPGGSRHTRTTLSRAPLARPPLGSAASPRTVDPPWPLSPASIAASAKSGEFPLASAPLLRRAASAASAASRARLASDSVNARKATPASSVVSSKPAARSNSVAPGTASSAAIFAFETRSFRNFCSSGCELMLVTIVVSIRRALASPEDRRVAAAASIGSWSNNRSSRSDRRFSAKSHQE